MTILLLDRDGTFEVVQVINLPILYPGVEQEVGVVARYRIEMEYLALNLARTRFMILSMEEVKTCEKDALSVCVSVSPVYSVGDRCLCVLELFQQSDKKIEESSGNGNECNTAMSSQCV